MFRVRPLWRFFSSIRTRPSSDSWRYNFSEADLPGIHVKVAPSQELSDALIRMSKEKGED